MTFWEILTCIEGISFASILPARFHARLCERFVQLLTRRSAKQ